MGKDDTHRLYIHPNETAWYIHLYCSLTTLQDNEVVVL